MSKVVADLFALLWKLTVAIVAGAVVGGLLFAALDWLRTYGAASSMESVSRTAVSPLPTSGNPLLDSISQVVEWYSTTFFGYSRFGSGLGILVGCFWAVGACSKAAPSVRLIVGFVAGLVIGFRLAIFVVSQPHLVLVAAVIASIVTGLYALLAGRKSKFSPLPGLQFKHQL